METEGAITILLLFPLRSVVLATGAIGRVAPDGSALVLRARLMALAADSVLPRRLLRPGWKRVSPELAHEWSASHMVSGLARRTVVFRG